MKWKLFLQIVLLLLIAGVIFYIVCPKYHFSETGRGRGNKITGEIARRTSSGGWGRIIGHYK